MDCEILPGVQAREVIAAHDQGEGVLWPALSHEGQRIRGVVGLGQVQLEAAGHQAGFAQHGNARHGQAMLLRTELAVLLERILGRYHQPHLIQLGDLEHVLGDGHVPHVRWVEGAKETTDVHALRSGVWGVSELARNARTSLDASWQAWSRSSFTITASNGPGR